MTTVGGVHHAVATVTVETTGVTSAAMTDGMNAVTTDGMNAATTDATAGTATKNFNGAVSAAPSNIDCYIVFRTTGYNYYKEVYCMLAWILLLLNYLKELLP